MQILMNGVRVNTDRLHKLSDEQINHALGNCYKPGQVPREHLEKALMFEIESMPKGKKGRRWGKSTTINSAINKAHRIKKKVHFGDLTVDEALNIRLNDPLLQDYLGIDDIHNAVDTLDGFITFEV